MANDPSIYDSREQLDFARRMAESLLKSGQAGYTPDAAMAKLPGTWMYGVPNIIKSISGAQYRDIAGDRESKLISQKSGVPDIPAQRYGARISQPAPQASRYDPSAPMGTPKVGMEGDDPQGRTAEVKQTAAYPGNDFLHKLIMTESGWNPNARTGSYRGLGQFGRAEEQRYGINDNNWNDPNVAISAIKKHMAWLYPQLEEELGRAPTPGELYLAHQQGVAGGPALLNNPDEPAWKAIRPYYKSDEMAKLAISGNIPKGNYLKQIPVDEIKSRDFAKLWTSRFDGPDGSKVASATPTSDETNIPPTADAGGQPTSRMNLGGPGLPGAEGSQQPTAQPLGEQVAQARNPQAPVVTTNPQMSPPQDIPGYGIPPAKPVMTPEQLDATLRMAPAANRAKIHEDHMKRMEGEDIDTPFGKQRITPPAVRGEQPIVTNMPNKTIPLSIEGITLHMVPRPDGSMDVLLPGGKGTQNFKDVTDIVRYAQQLKAEGSATNKLTEQKAEAVTSAQHEGMASVPAQRSIQQMLAISKATGKGMPSGPTKDFMKQFGQFYDNFVKGEKDKAWKDLPEAEAFDKLNSYLASESTKAITSRGTNFDLQTFMRANPSLSQTKEGRELMLDILNQEMETKIQLGIKASKYKAEDLPKFQEDVKKYYDEHPISVTLPSTGKKIIMKTLSKQERDQLEPGTGYIAPNGEVYYKK